MKGDLAEERARLHRLLTATDEDPVAQRIGLMAALAQARRLDQIGDIDDTRQLAGVLTRVVKAEVERKDDEATELAAGELLAVLSDIADDGDEDMAVGVNASVAGVSPRVIEIALSIARRRHQGLRS